jgi:uncharacterized protein YndB with AHSA1/START domain
MEVQPVRKEVVVDAPVERAFRVFTDKFDRWWPREHHIGKSEMQRAVIEPRVGGRWFEVGMDGIECDWGKVLVWEPPRRVVMQWQLNAAWEYDPELHTEVEISFETLGPMRTRVQLEHRGLERMGEAAAEVRAGLDSDQGWITHLTLFAADLSNEGVAASV